MNYKNNKISINNNHRPRIKLSTHKIANKEAEQQGMIVECI